MYYYSCIRYSAYSRSSSSKKKSGNRALCFDMFPHINRTKASGHEVNTETFLNHLVCLSWAILLLTRRNTFIWIEASSLKPMKSYSIKNNWKPTVSKAHDIFREEMSYSLQDENSKCSAHFMWRNNSVFTEHLVQWNISYLLRKAYNKQSILCILKIYE